MKQANDNRLVREPDLSIPQCVIVDLDGTVSIHQHRGWYEYHKVKDDEFDPRMKQLLKIFYEQGVFIVFMTGRERTPICEKETYKWLLNNVDIIQYNRKMDGYSENWCLIMRELGDHRKDCITKKELYHKYIEGKYNPICVFEDRDNVVDMWREMGILCNQVYREDDSK